jgi:hypothetical protein
MNDTLTSHMKMIRAYKKASAPDAFNRPRLVQMPLHCQKA